MITIDDFSAIEMRVGTILGAERVEGADRLLKLSVDMGEDAPRTIVSGIAEFYAPEDLVGTQACFVANLEPREIRGIASQGMILASRIPEGLALMRPDKTTPAGTVLG